MPLPTGLAYGRVTLRNIIGIADSADADDEPDIITMGGQVNFVPSIRDATLMGGGLTQKFFLRDVPGTIGTDGILKNVSGGSFVSLISTSSPGLTKQAWKWTAAITWQDGSKESLEFQLAPNQELNLATILSPVSATVLTVMPPVTTLTQADLDVKYATKTELANATGGGGVTVSQLNTAITTHENDTTPHPVYDDMNDLTLYFQNGMA